MLNITLLLPLLLSGGGVEWTEGSAFDAIRAADEANQQTWIYFWSGESENCTAFNDKVLSDSNAVSRLDSFVCIGANPGNTEGRKLVERYGIQTLPSMIILGPDGQVEDAIIGYIEVDNFTKEMDRILRNEGTVSALRASLTKASDGLKEAVASRDALAIKLSDVGQAEQAHLVTSEILELDPKGATLIGARVQLEKVAYELKTREKEEGVEIYELKPLYKHVKKIKHDEVKRMGWTMVANYEAHNEEYASARKAYHAMWQLVPSMEEKGGKEAAYSGIKLVDYYYATREDISKKEAKFALFVAEDLMKRRAASVAECEGGACKEDCKSCGQGMEAAFLYRVACAQHMCGDSQDAVDSLNRALEIAPGDKALESLRAEISTAISL